jgi:hypothetical protein
MARYIEEEGCILFVDTTLALAWKIWETSRQISAMIIRYRVQILTSGLRNTTQECYSVNRNVQSLC